MKNLLLLSLFLATTTLLSAQVRGTITDTKGEPLPFASVYVKGTSVGTTSNAEGEYELELQPGTYDLTFQFIGFQNRTESIRVGSRAVELNVELQKQAIDLAEVVVQANAEDPAYAIIRKAMAKRKYYRDLVEAYECNVYVKGNIKFLDAPEKFLGADLGDLGGTLDSNRQGIIYLSESKSNLYVKEPNQYKEEMLYSKVSGDDNGFSFNRASDMDFDLYENTSDFSRQIVSPIASNAFSYYDYRLEGTFPDEDGRLVNKIELLPKYDQAPAYRGYLYITSDLWNIQSADLLLLKSSINQPGLDSLKIKQVHVPIEAPDVWRLFSQTITFKAGLFGFELGGTFTGIYSNYDLEPNFPPGFFGNEVFKVNEGANDKALEFWDTLRPIPLTQEEAVDYVRKDSLQAIRTSKPYLDSIDAENNEFQFADLFFGYSRNNSYDRKYFTINSPATSIQFNTVQGWNADLDVTYRQVKDEDNTRWWDVGGSINYGFADKRLRGTLRYRHRLEQKNRTLLTLAGGIDAVQFNPANPIGETLNSLYSLWGRENYMKLYDKAFGRVDFERELVNGVFLRTGIEYAQRSPLRNSTDFTWNNNDEKSYTSNNPIAPDNDFSPAFLQNEALTFEAALRLRYKQKYSTYPNQKFIYGSDYPDLWITYRKGIQAFGSDVNYDLLSVRLDENYLSLGVIGALAFSVEAGKFINQNRLQFMDFRHFLGNQTVFGNPERYGSSFLLLPYYEYSTAEQYVQGHFQHDFNGWILNRIPLIRKLGFTEVFKAAYLHTEEQGSYVELGFGIDRIGIGAFRLLRLDFVWSKPEGNDWDFGYVIGLSLPIDEG